MRWGSRALTTGVTLVALGGWGMALHAGPDHHVNTSSQTQGDDAVAYGLGQELRCPVCQGMPIAESPAPMAQAMMQQVRDQVQAGRSVEDIRAYFVERYGEWVLLKPRTRGIALWVWLLPPVFFMAAAGWAVGYVRRLNAQRSHAWEALRASEDLTSGELSEPEDPIPDPYLQAIRDEVLK